MSRKDSDRKPRLLSRYMKNPSFIDTSFVRICLRPVEMTLAQNCTAVSPESFGNASNAFLTNLAASNKVIPCCSSSIEAD